MHEAKRRKSAPAGGGGAGRPRRSGSRGGTGTRLYLYGIAEGPVDGGPVGLQGIGDPPRDVFAIAHEGIFAIVSDAPAAEIAPTRRDALAHQRVLLSLMERHAVIPVSFGTTLGSMADVREILRGGYDGFVGSLAYVRARIELGLVVSWKPEAFDEELKRIGKEMAQLSRRRERHKAGPVGAPSLQAAISVGEAAAEALSGRAVELGRSIHEDLRKHAVASRIGSPLTERTILNAAYLVERARESEFDSRVAGVAASAGADRFDFEYTGPWPPYSFVDIKLKVAGPRTG